MGKQGRNVNLQREAVRRAQERERREAAPVEEFRPRPPVEEDDRSIAQLMRGNNRWDALRAVREAARQEASAARRRDRAVRHARAQGATWADLGRALGVSAQAVGQRYGRSGAGSD